MQAGRIKTSEPHITDNHQLEQVFGVFQPVTNSLVVGAYCGYAPANPRVAGRAGQRYLNNPFVISGVIQCVRNFIISLKKATQIHRLMQTINAWPSAADIRCSKMVNQVGGNLLPSGHHYQQRLPCLPFRKSVSPFGQFISFGEP